MMKIITVFGTRPELIRLSQVIKRLDKHVEQILIHTGQNYEPYLSEVFFKELEVRPPDIYLGIKSTSFYDQVSKILLRIGAVLEKLKADKMLVLGDTNSGLAAIIAARMGIKVYHMEAGNRCYDNRVPEEVNRRIIDHCSDVLLPYTHRSKENLLREGIERQRIYVIGNPIYEVLNTYKNKIDESKIMQRLNIEPREYLLATLHRAENVDNPGRLKRLFNGLDRVAKYYQLPVIVSLHPRTKDKLKKSGFKLQSKFIRLINPLGLFDFVKLEQFATLVLTDSGTVQEECCIFKVPNVTLRDVTERPETVECGSNIITGDDPNDILRCVKFVLESKNDWFPPKEYLEPNVSDKVVKIILGIII